MARILSMIRLGPKLQPTRTPVAAKHFDTGNWIVRQVFLSKLALAYFKEGAVKDPHADFKVRSRRLCGGLLPGAADP